MCGYIVLRIARKPDGNTGIIADLFAPPEDSSVLRTLLAFAVRYLNEQQVERIEAASSVDAYKTALLALGFKKKGEKVPMFHSKIKSPAVESALAPNAWFLGRSDHDWDQLP